MKRILPYFRVFRSTFPPLAAVLIGIGDLAHSQDSALSEHRSTHGWDERPDTGDEYLELVEGLCRFASKHQDSRGAFVDPFLGREHQYSTPYFAFAVGTLLEAGRALDLREAGIRAMDHATGSIAGGADEIPDNHGEFFIAPLADALELYQDFVSSETLQAWRKRLSVPVEHIIEGVGKKTNNWRIYAMKGEWSRYRAGLISRQEAVAFIEDAWLHRTQRERVLATQQNLYQDWNGDPQSHAVEAVGRANLLALIHAGYDGPSASEIRDAVENATYYALKLLDPTGQAPPNGRTDNHVFNDVLYGLAFEVMANRMQDRGEAIAAGRFRRAALLARDSIGRWRRGGDAWAGSFYVTKNRFDPRQRVGYQPASQYSNYNGAAMYHLAETWLTRTEGITQQPAPSETGGYMRLRTTTRSGVPS